eukprot:TRINITY_DN33128_c0_g1_i1.p1 TRINITY_DN33128_c0_g1~~TRINITY_DN33128_c0_g1_i1.p1  ORF type:complete len:552 (-),score=87.71 TRINITY_DN33128_c0_g1_i1:37-1692(-)
MKTLLVLLSVLGVAFMACELGKYPSGGACVDCPFEGCLICSNHLQEKPNCDKCAEGYVQMWDMGKMMYVCDACPEDCAECTPAGQCIRCKDHSLADPEENKCTSCSHIMEGCLECDRNGCKACDQYYYMEEGLCTKCADENCISCYKSLTDGLICSECNDGFYADRLNNRCVACTDPNCNQCKDDLTCMRCAEGFTIKDEDDTCIACPAGCADCEWTKEGDTETITCISCLDGKVRDENGGCDGPDKCKIGVPGETCFVCQDNNFEETTSEEFSLCTFMEGSGDKLAVCPTDECVSACTGPVLRYLIREQNNQYYDYCFTDNKCPSGFYQSRDNRCISCGKTCEECEIHSSHCTRCAYGYYPIEEGVCQKCEPGCKHCTAADHCTECDSGYVMMPTQHCQKGPDNCDIPLSSTKCHHCKSGYLKDGLCHACSDENCKRCSGADTCVECIDPHMFVNERGYCINCEADCSECAYRDTCNKCDIFTYGIMSKAAWRHGGNNEVEYCDTECPSDYYMLGKYCFPDGCPDGYLANEYKWCHTAYRTQLRTTAQIV